MHLGAPGTYCIVAQGAHCVVWADVVLGKKIVYFMVRCFLRRYRGRGGCTHLSSTGALTALPTALGWA